ncbi:hypothetical protein PTKIN_Ptkin13bG0132400 [Pterospermum kingtungense]
MPSNVNLRIHLDWDWDWDWDLDQQMMLKSGRMRGAPSAWNTHTMLYFCSVRPLRRAVALSCAIQVTAIQIVLTSFRELSALYDQTEAGTDSRPKLSCPLCRGEIYGWSVVQAAREFMNSKARSCSSDTCDFIGTYSELRKHARSDHPLARPTEVDPERQRDWTRFEQDRDYEDILSSMQTIIGEESNGERMSALELHSWFTLNLAYLALALEVINDARDIEQVQFRRRSGNRRFRYDQESDRGTRENSSFIPDRAFFSRRNNPSPVERFQGRQPSSQSRLHWRHSRPPSERVFQGRRQSSQADTTHRSQGLRWRTPRWSSTFNNGQ